MNPELRQTFNAISRNLESANETAQVNIYDFTSHYIDPCLSSIKVCFLDCTAACFPVAEDQLRRKRGRSRGRADFNFDFYDDWEENEDEDSPVVGWGDDELDSLLAGRGQPRAQRAMSYGARGKRSNPESDPNVIPKSSYLGFLDRLPFRFGTRGLRYKPSSAGLQENPGGVRNRDHQIGPIAEENPEEYDGANFQVKGHARNRSVTAASQSTTTSRSARSDLILSDEDEDAVPLDDEFASAMLSRRTTSTTTDELSISKVSSGKRPKMSRTSSRTASSKSLQRDKTRRSSSKRSLKPFSTETAILDALPEPAIEDLKNGEAHVKEEGELEMALKREAVTKPPNVVVVSGNAKSLSAQDMSEPTATSDWVPPQTHAVLHSPASPLDMNDGETEPFPDFSTATKSSQGGKPP